MRLRFQGAAGTVTGSRTLVVDKTTSFLVDCGLFQGPRDIRDKNWQPLEKVSDLKAVILTHAHIDHSGMLPLLAKSGFEGPVYCSSATADLCRIMLLDAAYLQEEDARFFSEKGLSRHRPPRPLFDTKDAEKAIRLLEKVPDEEWFSWSNGSRFRLRRSGHMLGSRFVEVGSDEGSILFSGDLGTENSVLLKEPVTYSEAEFLVLESTYGDRNHEKGDRFEQLARVVNEILGGGGTLVIPAFSVGRSQEVLFMLSLLEKQGKIPSVPTYLDSPMALDATEIFLDYPDELRPQVVADRLVSPLTGLNFKAVRSADESMLLCMDDSPKIVISAAGMLNGGRVLHHLKTRLASEKNGVLFVGYQVPETKGALLLNGLSKIRLHKQEVDVEARIFSMGSLSAHADSDGLIRWCSAFQKPPKRVFLNHGEDTARRTLGYRLRHELGWNVHLPSENEEVNLRRFYE